jgi:hypothetical protein
VSFTLAELNAVPDLETYAGNLAKIHWKAPGATREQLLACHHAARGGRPYRQRYNQQWHMALGAQRFATTGDFINMIPPFEDAGWGEYDPIAYAEDEKRRIQEIIQ